jgi:hypothetical protein
MCCPTILYCSHGNNVPFERGVLAHVSIALDLPRQSLTQPLNITRNIGVNRNLNISQPKQVQVPVPPRGLTDRPDTSAEYLDVDFLFSSWPLWRGTRSF